MSANDTLFHDTSYWFLLKRNKALNTTTTGFTYFVLTGDEIYREVHPEENESTTSSGSHGPQQEPNMVQWTVPGAQGRKRKRKTDHLESFLESYMRQKRRMDEADQKRRDEEKAVFENFFKMQQEAEERQFKAIREQQQANSQLLLRMMGTLVKALSPQSDAPPADCLPPTLTVFPLARHPTMTDPHSATSPQEISERPVAAMANSLTETRASLVNDINTQVFGRSNLFVTCSQGGWLR